MRPQSRRYRRRRARLTVATAAAAVLLVACGGLAFGLRDGAARRVLAGNATWHDTAPSAPVDSTAPSTGSGPNAAGGAASASTPETGAWNYASGQGRILG